MANQQIVEYIKGQLALGVDPKVLHFKLVNEGGWNPKDVDEAFAIASPSIPISNISKRPIKKMKIVLIILGVIAGLVALGFLAIYYALGGFERSSYSSYPLDYEDEAKSMMFRMGVQLDEYYRKNGVYPAATDCFSGIFAEDPLAEKISNSYFLGNLECRVYPNSYAISIKTPDQQPFLCVDSMRKGGDSINHLIDTGTETFCSSTENASINIRKIENSVENDYPNISENISTPILNGAKIAVEDMLALKSALIGVVYNVSDPSVTDCFSGIFAEPGPAQILKDKGKDMACYSYPGSASYAVVATVKNSLNPYCIDSTGFQGSGTFLFQLEGSVSCEPLE